MAYAIASTMASIKPIVETATPKTVFKYKADPEKTTDVAALTSNEDKPIAQIVPGIDSFKKDTNPNFFDIIQNGYHLK